MKTLANNSTARNSKNVRKYFLRLEWCSGHCTLKYFTRVLYYCKKCNVAELMSILFDTFTVMLFPYVSLTLVHKHRVKTCV